MNLVNYTVYPEKLILLIKTEQPIETSAAITEYEVTETEDKKDTDVTAQANDLNQTVSDSEETSVKTVYCNLASDEMVDTNQKVKQDEIIGSVGNTALFESVEQAHLHFEILKDNIPVDPAEYLPVE